MPKVSVTWAEAAASAAKYGAWLAKEAAEETAERGGGTRLHPPADGSGMGVRGPGRPRRFGIGVRAAGLSDARGRRALRLVSGHRVRQQRAQRHRSAEAEPAGSA